MISLNDFYKSVYSQSGEDGMLAKIFEELEISNGWFCEFGSGDGNNISNTRLLREKGWSGVLIEGDINKFNAMLGDPNISENPVIYPMTGYISCEDGEKIEDFLSKSPIPKDLDLISIDVDGNDLWIWKSMDLYRPKVVIIEYNSHFDESVTIRYDRDHRFNDDNYFGASAKALFKLGREKGYDLVGYTNGLNLIFIDSSINHNFVKIDPSDIKISIGWPSSNRHMIEY